MLRKLRPNGRLEEENIAILTNHCTKNQITLINPENTENPINPENPENKHALLLNSKLYSM